MIEIASYDMWEAHARGEVVCVTTNGTVLGGRNVMGGGTARQAAERYPNLPRQLAAKLLANGNLLYYFPAYRIVTFPTKGPVERPSDLDLIERSARRLVRLLDSGLLPRPRVILPKPGVGLGNLKWEDVKPRIEGILDDRVSVVSFGP